MDRRVRESVASLIEAIGERKERGDEEGVKVLVDVMFMSLREGGNGVKELADWIRGTLPVAVNSVQVDGGEGDSGRWKVEAAMKLLEEGEGLRDVDIKFLEGLVERGASFAPSWKQKKWLMDLARRNNIDV